MSPMLPVDEQMRLLTRGIEYGDEQIRTAMEQELRERLGEARYKAVTNIGRRPTFDKGERTIEVYLLDYQGDDFYGRDLRIELLERLRPERRFASADELRAHIQRDVAAARAALREG